MRNNELKWENIKLEIVNNLIISSGFGSIGNVTVLLVYLLVPQDD